MKLVWAIVQDNDALDLIDSLTEDGFRVTKLASTGGFLKSGNTTLMIGVESEKVDDVIKTIEDICKVRKQCVSTVTTMGGHTDMFISCPTEINVGGATIFVTDVDKFKKI